MRSRIVEVSMSSFRVILAKQIGGYVNQEEKSFVAISYLYEVLEDSLPAH
jgi:hypothetical protein